MTTPFSERHDTVLTQLEQREMAWLSWGNVDGASTEAEVIELALAVVRSPKRARELVDDLLDWNLLLDVGDRELRLRSRFAESVRLMVRNRQQLRGRHWRAAAQLVNDFRVLARQRTFPRRDVSLEDAFATWNAELALSAPERAAIAAMLKTEKGFLDLSQFQVDATLRIRSELYGGTTSATIVCAGTGSGKTKAFYLPTLAAVAGADDGARWVRILAIYPRNELLKDQLTSALTQVEAIAAGGGPVLAVGALFGPTQGQHRDVAKDAVGGKKGWTKVSGGFACRYLRCPCECLQDLVWSQADFDAGRELLTCPECRWRSRLGQIVLTRDALKSNAPHLLFTTTEMLNRALADASMRPLVVGAHPARRPNVLLLDEVHTYGGVHGAQVALLLRRWRHALGLNSPIHLVGLSATLEAPTEFVRALTGIDAVEEIRPRHEDMRSTASEYSLVLRGNPVSGTALLSTTIQTGFLLARLLESRQLRDRTSTSGSRVFAFTDNLDVTNRLYWDLRSAEDINGRRGPLAQLRAEGAADGDLLERDHEGQVWKLPTALGWQLDAGGRLSVKRTSSQDAGVDLDADVIVATSALEVGFDDPQVGAVIQHKAPRDDAAFIQRKGRAGRQATMRPWTVVVLSDYGRDRVRYQAYESLFAPVLAPRTLPVDNLHVLKMQAAFAVLDWLAIKVPNLKARSDLSQHRGDSGARAAKQEKVARLLHEVMENPRAERDLERFIRGALALTPAQVRAVMWNSPRAVMTSVIPTLHRRLASDWSTAAKGGDRIARDAPLPEHAPRALFSDLNLPEVSVSAPRQFSPDAPRIVELPIVQALSEFVPGRASRRFAVESFKEWHWVPRPSPHDDGTPTTSNVDDWVTKMEPAGDIAVAGESEPRPLLRPWAMKLELASREDSSSNARPRWTTNVRPRSVAWIVNLPATAAARRVFVEFGFHTHALGNETEVARGIPAVSAEAADGVASDIGLVNVNGSPVALGFTAHTDAVRLRIARAHLPDFVALAPPAQRAMQTSWFQWSLANDPVLCSRMSGFTIGWVSTLYLAAVTGIAIAEQAVSLRQAIDSVEGHGVRACMLRALDGVFVASDSQDDGEARGITRLKAVLDDPEVVDRVAALGHDLAQPNLGRLDAHVSMIAVVTAGAALREAFQRMAPTFDVDGLVIDIESRDAGTVDVWLSEPEVGSGGTVEELRRRASEDPGRLARLLSAAVAPTDFEIVDRSVRRILTLATSEDDVADTLRAVREADTGVAAAESQRALRGLLRSRGLGTDHSIVSTLNLRVLRPGSTVETDRTLLAGLELWDRTEETLGLELDARSVAYAMSRSGTMTLEQSYSLLWPRGRDARGSGLGAYSRFSDHPTPDRLTLADVLVDEIHEIAYDSETEAAARVELARSGVVRLTAELSDTEPLQALVMRLLTTSIDVGSVAGFARVVGGERLSSTVAVVIELPEASA